MIFRHRCEDKKYHNCYKFKIYYNIYDDLDDYNNNNDGYHYRYDDYDVADYSLLL
jgi:hypothetical protein